MSALGQERDIEVHEQTNWQSRQLQIGDDLRFVDRRKLLDNLQFNFSILLSPFPSLNLDRSATLKTVD